MPRANDEIIKVVAPITQHTPAAARARHWNALTETMPRAELDALHLKKLQKLADYVYDYSAFYRRKFDEIGLKPAHISSLDEYKRLVPIIDKADFIAFQQERPPYGDTIAVPLEMVAHHVETSGSTGVPLAVPYTAYDTERVGESWTYGFWAHGIRPVDSFYFAFNWRNFAGFWSCYFGARRMGCRVISGGGANSEGHIQNILRLKPTVLISTPTFAVRLAQVAEEMGVDLRDSSVNFTYHAGEPGPFALPAMKAQIDEAWGADSGELLGIAEIEAFAPGCAHRDGVHVNEMNVFCWSVDPDTGEEVDDGEIGENIITSYTYSGQPLLNPRLLVRGFLDQARRRRPRPHRLHDHRARDQCLSDRGREHPGRGRRGQPLFPARARPRGGERPHDHRVRARQGHPRGEMARDRPAGLGDDPPAAPRPPGDQADGARKPAAL